MANGFFLFTTDMELRGISFIDQTGPRQRDAQSIIAATSALDFVKGPGAEMSASSQPVEFSNWKPAASEIAELLLSLGISPPRSLDGISFRSNTDSCGNLESLDYVCNEDQEGAESGCVAEPLINDLDRDTLIEYLGVYREQGRLAKWANNCFHEYLVEHFKRKQMMHVYTDESEDDVLLNEYLRKLDELERSDGELRRSRDEWDAELSRTRADIRGRKEDAADALNETITRERQVGASTWNCGKLLGLKRVQALIGRQLDRIRDIAKFRLRYTRLRDELVSKEAKLSRIMISSPNLTKEDYERLEAEQFYYRRELASKDDQCVGLIERWDRLARRHEAVNRKIARIDREIDDCQRAIGLLRDSVKTSLEEKRAWLTKLLDVRRFIDEFNEVVGQSSKSEFAESMADIRREHEEWMAKISKTLKDIKDLGQSLNAVRANLMLHGKKFDFGETGQETKSLSHSPNLKNGNDQPLQ